MTHRPTLKLVSNGSYSTSDLCQPVHRTRTSIHKLVPSLGSGGLLVSNYIRYEPLPANERDDSGATHRFFRQMSRTNGSDTRCVVELSGEVPEEIQESSKLKRQARMGEKKERFSQFTDRICIRRLPLSSQQFNIVEEPAPNVTQPPAFKERSKERHMLTRHYARLCGYQTIEQLSWSLTVQCSLDLQEISVS